MIYDDEKKTKTRAHAAISLVILKVVYSLLQ